MFPTCVQLQLSREETSFLADKTLRVQQRTKQNVTGDYLKVLKT